jgi:DNA ligase-4
MFFIMEGRDEEFKINVDPFNDSYARDTNVDELKEVRVSTSNPKLSILTIFKILKEMEVTKQQSSPFDPRTLHKIESHIQAKIDSGYTAPCGWLFRGLTFFFSSRDNQLNESSASNRTNMEDTALCLAHNTARFASAHIATSLNDSKITHIIVNLETSSREDIASLRESLAARSGKKIPHLVSLNWVQESWENGTLLDEESKLTPFCTTAALQEGNQEIN